MVLVAGSDALEKGDSLWVGVIGRTHHLARGGARGAEQPLELQVGHHVRVAAETVLGGEAGVVQLEPRGQHHRAYRKLPNLLLVVVNDRAGLASPLALQTLGAYPAVETAVGLRQRHLLG